MLVVLCVAALVVGLFILHGTAGTGDKYSGLRSFASVIIFIAVIGILSQIRCNVGR